MADGQELEKRIKALEDGSVDIKKEVDTCKAVSESNSKWYMHQGIVTISVLALLLTAISVVGYYGGKNLIKRNVKTSVEDRVSISVSKFETEVNRKLHVLDEKFDSFMVKTEKKVDEAIIKLKLPDVLVSKDENKIEIGDKLEFENWYDMGTGAFRHQRYKKAIQYFSNALETKPSDTDAEAYTYNYIGLSHARSNEHLLAIKNFNKAATLKQDYAIAIDNRAVVYFTLKEYLNSINSLNESSKIYESKGNYEKALNNIVNAISIINQADNSKRKAKLLQEYTKRKKGLEEAKNKGTTK